MSKNLMVISQKVFAPAAFIARKMHTPKKFGNSRKKMNISCENDGSNDEEQVTIDEDPIGSFVSELTEGEEEDMELRERGLRTPELESVQDCPIMEELPAPNEDQLSIKLAPNSGTMQREARPFDSPGRIYKDGRNGGAYYIDEEQNGSEYVIANASVVKNKLSKRHKKGELDDTYALREKVTELEGIVRRQSDEIACLKSAMADNLRRLQILEESRDSQKSMQTSENGGIKKKTGKHPKVTSSGQWSNQNPRRPMTATGGNTIRRHHKLSADSTPVRTKHNVSTLKGSSGSGKKTGAGRGVHVSSPALNHLGISSRNKSSKYNSTKLMSNSMKLSVPKSNVTSNHSPAIMPHTLSTRPWRPAGTPNPEAPKIHPLEIHTHTPQTPSSTSPHISNGPGGGKQLSPFSAYYGKKTMTSSFKQKSVKEPIYDKDEGILKMYIKGKPISLHMPSFAQPIDLESHGRLPKETLKLEWVYGYRGRDARSNIYYLPTGEIVYFIAAVVILYNMEEQTQRHYLGHTDDVKSIAVHPDKITIATGQIAGQVKQQGKPHVRIWSSVNLSTLFIIGLGDFERSVCCLAFSRADGGQYLAAIDEANEHVMSVWLWEKEKKISEAKCSTEPILSADFHPTNSECIVTCGKSHLVFWNFKDRQLTKKQAVYEKHEKPKFVLCQTFLETGEVVTGDSSGNISVWNVDTYKIEKLELNAHEGPIFSLMLTKNNTILSGGGKDRLIREWDSRLVRSGYEVELSEQQGPIRMLTQGPGAMVLVGTTKNCILQMFLTSDSHGNSLNNSYNSASLSNGMSVNALRSIVDGHTEEAWALTCHPRQHRFISVSHDASLCLWDGLTRRLLWRRDMMDVGPLLCVAWYPCGGASGGNGGAGNDILVIGTGSSSGGGGRWVVVDASSQSRMPGNRIDGYSNGSVGRDQAIVRIHSDGTEPILCVAYSPDGRLLAVGSGDSSIYIYSVSDNGTKYSRIGRCTGHSGAVTHLDWSSHTTDSQNYLRSQSMATQPPELCHWSVGGTGNVQIGPSNAGQCRQISMEECPEIRDSDWSSQSCPVQWASAGVWREDSPDITAVGAGHTLPLLCSADEVGRIGLYEFPATHPKTLHHQYKGHSSHVTSIQFLFDDSRVISSGGKDTSIMQWEIL